MFAGQGILFQPRSSERRGDNLCEEITRGRRSDAGAGQAPAGEPGQQTGLGLRQGLCGVHVAVLQHERPEDFVYSPRVCSTRCGSYHPGRLPTDASNLDCSVPGCEEEGLGTGHGKALGESEPCLFRCPRVDNLGDPTRRKRCWAENPQRPSDEQLCPIMRPRPPAGEERELPVRALALPASQGLWPVPAPGAGGERVRGGGPVYTAGEALCQRTF